MPPVALLRETSGAAVSECSDRNHHRERLGERGLGFHSGRFSLCRRSRNAIRTWGRSYRRTFCPKFQPFFFGAIFKTSIFSFSPPSPNIGMLRKRSRYFCPLLNFQSLEIFPVSSKKKGGKSEKRCSIRAALSHASCAAQVLPFRRYR